MRRLSDQQVGEAAALLLALRRGEITMDDLPDPLIPETTADIQRIIDATNAEIDRPVVGWKIYCVYKPMQPIFFAPIYDIYANYSVLPEEVSQLRLIEPEIMFRVDRDLIAREARYSNEELASALTAVVGFEIIGSRFRMESLDDIYKRSKAQRSNYGSLSDNIANGCIVVGDEIPRWRDVAFEDVTVRMTQGEKTMIEFKGGHPFDDPFLAALVGVNRMRRTRDIKAGQIIVTSSSTSFFPAQRGDAVVAEYEGVGRVAASFA